MSRKRPKYRVDNYWVDNDPHISPHIHDIDPAETPVVRVKHRCPPFALGDVVCFFVGGDAARDAEAFCRAMNLEGNP